MGARGGGGGCLGGARGVECAREGKSGVRRVRAPLAWFVGKVAVSLTAMRIWIALLRGINVGGHNVVPMAELRKLLDAIGCEDVRTYIQSGNAVFRSAVTQAGELSSQVASEIADAFGFEPRVFCLERRALERAMEANPFPEAEAEPKTLHLNFLAKKPAAGKVKGLEDLCKESERYRLVGTCLYVHAPEGLARSKLAAGFEKRLGVDATGRNWRTVEKLRALAADGGA